MSSSSSDDSEDERLAHFREAIDPNLINDQMFQCIGIGVGSGGPSNSADDPKQQNKISINQLKKPASSSSLLLHQQKSQRYLDADNDLDSWKDFKASESMQKHVSKKLSEIIRQACEFIDVSNGDDKLNDRNNSTKTNKKRKKSIETSINESQSQLKLLKDTEPITTISDDPVIVDDGQILRQKYVYKKRYPIEIDNTMNVSENDKCKLSTITLEQIQFQHDRLQKILKKNYSRKPNHNVLHYKDINGVLHLIEPNT